MASPDEGSSSLHLGGRSQQRGGRGKRPASTSVSSADSESKSPGFRRKRKLIQLRFLLPRTSTLHVSGDRPRCETSEQGRSPRSSSPDDSGPASLRDQQQQQQAAADGPGKERRSRSFSPLPRPVSPAEPASSAAAAAAADLHQPRPASSGSRSNSAGSASHSQRAPEGPPPTADFSHPVQLEDDACVQGSGAEKSASRPRKIRRRRAVAAVKRRRHRHSQERRDRARDPQRKRRRRHRAWRRRKRRSLSPPGDRSGGSSPSRSESPSPHSSSHDSPRAGTSSSGKEITLARNLDAAWRLTQVEATSRRNYTSTAGTSSGSTSPRARSPASRSPDARNVDLSKLKSSLKDSTSAPRLMFTRFDLRPQSKGVGASQSTSQGAVYTHRRVAIDLGLVLISELLNIIWFSFNPSSVPLGEAHESYKWRRKMEANSDLSTVLKTAAKNRPAEFQQLPSLMQDAIQLCSAADSICNTRNHMVHYNHDAMEEVLESIEAFKREKLLGCLSVKSDDSPKVKDVIELLKHFLTSAHILVNVLLDNRLYLKLVEQMLLYFAYAAGLVARRLEWVEIIEGSRPHENKIGKGIMQSIYDQIQHDRKGNLFANKVKRPTRFDDPVPQTVMSGGLVALAKYIDEKMFFIKTTIGPSTVAATCHDLSETIQRFEKYRDMNIITDKVLSHCELFYTIVLCTTAFNPQLGMSPTFFDKMKKEYSKELQMNSPKRRRPHLWLD